MGANNGLTGVQKVLLSLTYSFLHLIRIFGDYIIYPIACLLKGGTSKPLPPIKDKILLMSGTDLAERIRNGELSSVNVVKSFIRRIREVNPVINAITDERYKEALEDAKKADEVVKEAASHSGKLQELKRTKPFLGVPITTKNALAVKDLGNESGLYMRKGYKSSEDSEAMGAMRAAGAIPLAVTNVPELCLWSESSNTLHGRTNNPYNTYRTCGGSSGGEGALLSSCGSPFGVGTDIAGSVRIPAAYNGLFGLKPTMETVSIEGHYPMPGDILKPLLIAGPMSKHAKDIRPMLSVLAGENAMKMKLSDRPDISKTKVFYMEDFGSKLTPPVTSEIRERIVKVAEHLSSISSSKPRQLDLPRMAYTMEMYLAYMVTADIPSFAQELTMLKGEISPGREFIKWTMGQSRHTLPAIFVTIMERVGQSNKKSKFTETMFNMSKLLGKEIEDILRDDGVLVVPTFPEEAPYHSLSILRPANLGFTGIFNILGVPALHCPIGLAKSGMPIGVTIVANKYKDNLCIEIAHELERQFGGWVCPTEVVP